MALGIIVASDLCRVIGVNNSLPWKSKADLKRFKELTMGSSLIMGRTTWESIGRPLPGRQIFVVTHRPFEATEGVEVCSSLEEALAKTRGTEQVWIAGGASIYRQALPFVTHIDHTIIPETVPLPLDKTVPIALFPDLPADFIPREETKNPYDSTLVIKTYYRRTSLQMKAVASST